MAAPQFHETVYGHRFFEAQLPQLIKAINRLAAAVERNNELLTENECGKNNALPETNEEGDVRK